MKNNLIKPLSLFLAVLLLTVLMLPVLAETPAETAPEAEEPINFFAELKLTDLKGNPFDASVFKGKPAFINIWATWCSPAFLKCPTWMNWPKGVCGQDHHHWPACRGHEREGWGTGPLAGEKRSRRGAGGKAGPHLPIINPDQNLFALMMSPDYGLQVSAYPTTWLIDENGSVASIVPGSRDKAEWQKSLMAS